MRKSFKINLDKGIKAPTINLDKVIWPACLPARGEEYNLWKDSEVQGWGSISTTGWNIGGGDDQDDREEEEDNIDDEVEDCNLRSKSFGR